MRQVMVARGEAESAKTEMQITLDLSTIAMIAVAVPALIAFSRSREQRSAPAGVAETWTGGTALVAIRTLSHQRLAEHPADPRAQAAAALATLVCHGDPPQLRRGLLALEDQGVAVLQAKEDLKTALLQLHRHGDRRASDAWTTKSVDAIIDVITAYCMPPTNSADRAT